MSSKSKAYLEFQYDGTGTTAEPHVTLQGAVTWRNQCHDRPTLQGVRIASAILKILFCHTYFLNAVLASTSGGIGIVSDTLVDY